MKLSLRVKMIILVVYIAVSISVLAVVIFNRGISNVVETQYEARSIDIANLVAQGIDGDTLMPIREAMREIYEQSENKVMSSQWGTPEFEAYVSQFYGIEEMDGYQEIFDNLRRMQDVLDVNCLTLTWLDAENKCYLYVMDADYEEPCPIGCIDPLFLENPEALVDPAVGLPPTISNSPEYGWLISTGMPIFDSTGEVVAYSTVDISMNAVVEQETRYLLYTVLAFLGATVLVSLLGIWFVTRYFIRPINTLSEAAAQYNPGQQNFSELRIYRGDEIGFLADSMARMEADVSSYIENLRKTTADLLSAQEAAIQLNRIANIDPLTSVRNKRAYDVEAARLDKSMKPYGIVMIDLNGLKKINDTYGHEKGDISIKRLSRIICQTFTHSPVFRVGGDEFIVILENDDYTERDELLKNMMDALQQNAANESLQPWERITAAVGWALWDPASGSSADLVLKQADFAMYQRKKAMKKNER